MSIFRALEDTGLARWVGESLWGYPILLSLHVIGLAIVVGIFVMRDLRLLGFFEGIPAESLAALSRLGWAGFVINALSGFALFSSQASLFVESVPFLTKISSITAAAICGVVIQRRLGAAEVTPGGEAAVLPPSTRPLALLSIVLWVSAIFAGRLIAYL